MVDITSSVARWLSIIFIFISLQNVTNFSMLLQKELLLGGW